MKPYVHLVWCTAGFTAISFLLGLGFVDWPLITVCLGSIGMAAITLVAFWSVLGPGSYLQRFLISHAAGLVLAAGMALGMTLSFSEYVDGEELWYPTIMVMLSILPLTVAAQLPYWVMRGCFGWQLTHLHRPPVAAFSIREIFALTFMFAIAIVAAQYSADFAVKINQRSIENLSSADEDTVTLSVEQRDGSFMLEEHPATQENLEVAAQAFEGRMRSSVLFGYAAYAGITIVISSLSIPLVYIMFRPRESTYGCLLSLGYAAIIGAVAIVVLVLTRGIQPFFPDILGYVIMVIVSVIGITSFVSMLSRLSGIELTSPKRYERQSGRLQHENFGSLDRSKSP